MKLDDYQKAARRTDRVPRKEGKVAERAIVVPMLGLAGEAGQLLSEYKKHLRDGDAHELFKERVAEELGDLLWYVADLASKFDLQLGQIAEDNLKKTADRWLPPSRPNASPDDGLPDPERLPRQFMVELFDDPSTGRLLIKVDGENFGDPLTDNAWDEDGYRFHDVFHFAYAAILGWSPVIRKLLKRKRRSDSKVDEIEDGGRAGVIEEGVSALVFSYARKHQFLAGVGSVDSWLLSTIKSMTEHLEVRQCTTGEWERAILLGFEMWRQVIEYGGGRLRVDLDAKDIIFEASACSES